MNKVIYEPGTKKNITEITITKQKNLFRPGVAGFTDRLKDKSYRKTQNLKKIENGDLAWTKNLVTKQETAGASVIGVNLGMQGIDESNLLVQEVEILEKASDRP
ncbi:MAG: hypothetical protein BA865_02210 [Desulfobacterales bacterium S5133MH4]|nr:MAG: hypothetical protein BA865_02210 [Desulfobacterales bacterium S5133MH4]